MLTQNAPYGKARGTITLNGKDINKAVFAEHCAVVPQFDDSWGQLTVQETVPSPFASRCLLTDVLVLQMVFAAKLFGRHNPEQAADEVITAMGLGKCRDTKVLPYRFNISVIGYYKHARTVCSRLTLVTNRLGMI